jgi:hypothetical protein
MALEGQDPVYWQLTDDDGLPSNIVYNVAQDSSGFIWLGTSNGICKYDGTEFTTFSHPEMLDNEVLTIQVDQQDRIWFNNLSGQLFFIQNDSCHLFYNLEWGDSLSLSSFLATDFKLILGFYPLDVWQAGKGLILTYDLNQPISFESPSLKRKMKHFFYKIYKSDISSSTIEIFSLKDPITSQPVPGKEERGIYKWSVDADSIGGFEEEFSSTFKITADKFGRVNAFFESEKKEEFFLIFHDVITSFEKSREYFKTNWADSIGTRINNLVRYRERILILTQSGFRVLNGDSISPVSFLSEIEINHGFVDKQQNIWLTTNGDGTLVIPSLETEILSNESITALNICHGNKELVAATKEGDLFFFSTANNFQKFNTGYKNDISAIESIDENFYLVGTDIELFQFDKENPGNQRALIDRPFAIKALKLRSDSLLIGNYNMARIVPFQKHKSLEPYLLNPAIISERSYSLFPFENKVYVGTYQGLYTYEDGQTKKILFGKGNSKLGTVLKMEEDLDGNLWGIGNGTGLFRVKDNEVVEVLNDSFPNLTRNCNGFTIDSKGRFWIATPEGVFLLDKSSKKLQVFNKKNGLPTSGINHIEFFDGKIFCSTEKGLIRIPENLFENQTGLPSVNLRYAKLLGSDKLLSTNSKLDHNSNFIEFGYSGLSFKAKQRVIYQYRLKGLSENWVFTEANTIQFPGLSPGNYELEVYALNYLGEKSIRPATFFFTIAPPWYNTWWFYLLISSLGLGIIGTIFQLRYRNLQKREALKREFSDKVNQLRMEALQTQMNPHFIFNAMNAIQHYLTISDGENAMKYLAKFARLIRLIFEQSKEKFIALDDEIELLELYLELEKLRFGDRIQTSLSISKEINAWDDIIQIPPLVIQPMVENAFRHGLFHKEGQGQINIRFEMEDGYLTCTIEDDGIGLSKSKLLIKDQGVKKYRSSGISSTKERLAIHHNMSTEEFSKTDFFAVKNKKGPNGDIRGVVVFIKFKLSF